jgi:hypothetical protein
MAHESTHRDEQVVGSSNRSFGIVFAVVFLIIALYPVAFGRPLRFWSIVVAAGFLLVALAAPALLGPLNRIWLKFGLLLHRVVSPLILGVLFFIVVTPTGLLMRALSKDPLRLRKQPQASSYWIERSPPGPKAETFTDQF